MKKDKRITELEQENASLQEKNRFLRKQNKELWKQNKELWSRIRSNIIADVAREMSGCKNRLI